MEACISDKKLLKFIKKKWFYKERHLTLFQKPQVFYIYPFWNHVVTTTYLHFLDQQKNFIANMTFFEREQFFSQAGNFFKFSLDT